MQVVLLSFLYGQTKQERIKFLEKFYCAKDLIFLYPMWHQILETQGFIYEDRLTNKGLFTILTSSRIHRAETFMKRALLGINPPFDIYVLFKEPVELKSSFVDDEDVEAAKDVMYRHGLLDDVIEVMDLYRQADPFISREDENFLLWLNGFFYFIPHLSRIPGNPGKLSYQYEYVIRTMKESRRLGLANYSDEDVYLTACSIKNKGFPFKWSLIGTIHGVGYFYGHALIMALKSIGAYPPKLGSSIANYFTKIPELEKVLAEVIQIRHNSKDFSKKVAQKLVDNLRNSSGVFRDEKVEKILNFDFESQRINQN